MKRSEMLDVIQAELLSCIDNLSGQLNTETAAKFILRAIEDHGMLPPESQHLILGSGLNNYMVNVWDEEDLV